LNARVWANARNPIISSVPLTTMNPLTINTTYWLVYFFEHLCSKHVEAWNKLIKFSASSWLILR
jgi:hypothetical protein